MSGIVLAPRVGYRRGADGQIEKRRFETADLPEGWFGNRAWVDDAPEPAPPPPASEDDDEPDTKVEAVALAEALGIDIDRRWGLARIKAAIEAETAKRSD